MKTRQDFEFYLQEHLNDLFLLTGVALSKTLPPPVWMDEEQEYSYTDVLECLRKVERKGISNDPIRAVPGWDALNVLLDHSHLVGE